MPFRGLTHVGPRNKVLDGRRDPHGEGHLCVLSAPFKTLGIAVYRAQPASVDGF